MSTEIEENTEFTSNGDNTSSITTHSESYDVTNKSPRNPTIEERFFNKMFSCSRETICLILAVTFSLAFAALHSTPPKISKPPPARPFFNQNSIIIDFYRGQLNAMIDRASDADLNFVMYYAPWDAESQAVRYEFEHVAHYYFSKILFSAINCWHPGSECRNQYSKIQSYPVLVLYPSRGTGIQYKGIYSTPYIIRFLDAFLRPIHRISNQKDLMELITKHDSVLVGFFNFKGPSMSPGYKEFYRAAIRALERDPNRDVIFAAVTNANISLTEFNIVHTPSASLHLWNESLIYPEEKLWTAENILKWMERSIHKVSLWLQPPGIKSSTLAPYLRDGPVLLLFTPRNPLHSSNYNHDLIREVALEYYNCGKNMIAQKLINQLRIKRKYSAIRYYEEIERCLELTANTTIQSTSSPIPISITVQQWINDSCCAQVFLNKCMLCKNDDAKRNNICIIASSKSNICKKKDIFKVSNNHNNYNNNNNEPVEEYFCCDNQHSNKSKENVKKYVSSRIIQYDSRSAVAVYRRFIHDDCTKFLAGDKYNYPIFPDKLDETRVVQLDTFACNVNKTMTFLSIDSLNYFHFAEGLGIDILKMRDKTAVVILDSLRESQYLLSENLSRNSLVKFINNYNNGYLSRTLRSDTIRQYARHPQIDLTCKKKNPSEVCIVELNTSTFLTTILDPTKDIVVMYYSSYCAFCSAISFVYLTVANLLSNVNRILFVRIDGDNNDLPWEYSMNRYPSILFFPAKSKEDSTMFPTSLPITVANLLNFVLANLEGDIHIEALINVCHKGLSEPAGTCVARVRRICLDVIYNNLQNYRKLLRYNGNSRRFNLERMNKRREILVKLEHIRDIHLILSFVDDLNKNPATYQQLIQKFDIYYKNLIIIKKHIVNVDRVFKKTRITKRKITNDEL